VPVSLRDLARGVAIAQLPATSPGDGDRRLLDARSILPGDLYALCPVRSAWREFVAKASSGAVAGTHGPTGPACRGDRSSVLVVDKPRVSSARSASGSTATDQMAAAARGDRDERQDHDELLLTPYCGDSGSAA